MSGLNWALVIATKDRIDTLCTTVTLAVEQTRPPVEVVIVDASNDWADNEARLREIVATRPAIRFEFIRASVASLTVQRNQGIAAARADILFMIDDDSFMFPDCAEEIMAVYEADVTKVVGGVQAEPTSEMPTATSGSDRKSYAKVGQLLRKPGPVRWFLKHVLLFGREQQFVPYETYYRTPEVPVALRELPVVAERMFTGFRMTFRREAIAAVGFEPLLRYYCPAEDFDASYRMSMTYSLLTAQKARMHHFENAAARLRVSTVKELKSLNIALFLAKNIPGREQAKSLFLRHTRKLLVAEILKDMISMDRHFFRTCTVLKARRLARPLFDMSLRQLNVEYPLLQERIVNG